MMPLNGKKINFDYLPNAAGILYDVEVTYSYQIPSFYLFSGKKFLFFSILFLLLPFFSVSSSSVTQKHFLCRDITLLIQDYSFVTLLSSASV